MKHVNPSEHLHEVYTIQGGVKEYNKNQQALGALKCACAVVLIVGIVKHVGEKMYNAEIKALKPKKGR